MTEAQQGAYRSANYVASPNRTISVVTPSYNQAEHLVATLESVLSQHGDFQIDHVVMDGGSTDGSVDLLRQHEASLRRRARQAQCNGFQFRWISRPDGGQAEAINTGFEMADGDLFCWLNSDDLFANANALARVFAYFKAHPDAAFLYGRAYEIDFEGGVCGTHRVVVEYQIEDLLEIDYIVQPAAFWRRAVYERIGPLNQSMHFAFDWEYWIRISREFKFHFLNEFLACNRVYPENKSLSGGEARRREIAQLLTTHGKLTDRSINAYLSATPDMHAIKKGNRLVRRLLGPVRQVEHWLRPLWNARARRKRKPA